MSAPSSASPFPSPRETLQRAIQIETRNATIYDTFAQLFQGYEDAVTSIFQEMADEERQHEAELLQRYRERYHDAPPPGPDPKEVIEAPDLDDAEAFIFDSMTVEQALEAGLRAEESARAFYRREVGRTTDPELQKVYRELGEFEERHVRLLEEKLAEKRGGPNSTRR
jgi:rubrerythrin